MKLPKLPLHGLLPAALLLPLTVSLLYGHTLHVPWYLDDGGAIRDNLLIRDLWATLENLATRRGLLNLSFALNYRFAGLSLPAFHLVNIAIHAAAGIVVCLILRRLFPGRPLLALLGALLFVAHPLQTQAVTYLVQRAASLGGLFFLLAFYLYLLAREALTPEGGWRRAAFLAPYLGAVGCGALAVLTKENTVTLPLLLLAYERLFPRAPLRSWRQDLLTVLPFCLAPLAAVLAVLAQGPLGGWSPNQELATLAHNSPLHYLATQFQVVWVYLRLLLLPYGQALEHNYPVVASLFEPLTLLGLAGVAGVWWWGWHLRHRLPLAAFGIAWFFLTLAVESSLIPLDPLFEHRLYLPLFGLLVGVLDRVPAWCGERRAAGLLLAVLLVCAPLTWQRNRLWNDPVAFHEDNLIKAPESERTLVNLAKLYVEQRRKAEAQRLLEKALRINPESAPAAKSLAMVYVGEGRQAEAVALLDEAIRRNPADPQRYEDAALLRLILQQPQAAADCLLRGLAATPQSIPLRNNLGVVYAGMGRWADAEQAYRQSLALGGVNPKAHDNLGEALVRQGRVAEAARHFRLAAEQLPGEPRLLLNAGIAAHQAGDPATVQWAAARLKRFDRDAWRELLTQTGGGGGG